jgi:hypothetical protein
MKLVWVACTLALAACAGRQSDTMLGYGAHAVLGGGRFEGAAIQAMTGVSGVYVEGEASVRGADRRDAPDTYQAVGAALATRVSLFGLLGTSHELERYFDLGGAAGAGGGWVFGPPPHDIAGFGSAWYGAWVDLGTVAIDDGYLAVTGGVRREVFGDPWNDRTQLMVGLAWRRRAPFRWGQMGWHD